MWIWYTTLFVQYCLHFNCIFTSRFVISTYFLGSILVQKCLNKMRMIVPLKFVLSARGGYNIIFSNFYSPSHSPKRERLASTCGGINGSQSKKTRLSAINSWSREVLRVDWIQRKRQYPSSCSVIVQKVQKLYKFYISLLLSVAYTFVSL